MEDLNVVFNFDDQVEKDTFHHLIAHGDKSNRVLKHLKLDLGNWVHPTNRVIKCG